MNNKNSNATTPQALPKWRLWVRDNKTKILAVIGVALTAIGGEVVGITDFVSAWFF